MQCNSIDLSNARSMIRFLEQGRDDNHVARNSLEIPYLDEEKLALLTQSNIFQKEHINTASLFQEFMKETEKIMQLIIHENAQLSKKLTELRLLQKKVDESRKKERKVAINLIEDFSSQLKETNHRLLELENVNQSLEEQLQTINQSEIKMISDQKSTFRSSLNQKARAYQVDMHSINVGMLSNQQQLDVISRSVEDLHKSQMQIRAAVLHSKEQYSKHTHDNVYMDHHTSAPLHPGEH
jgi:hypothetical protein